MDMTAIVAVPLCLLSYFDGELAMAMVESGVVIFHSAMSYEEAYRFSDWRRQHSTLNLKKML